MNPYTSTMKLIIASLLAITPLALLAQVSNAEFSNSNNGRVINLNAFSNSIPRITDRYSKVESGSAFYKDAYAKADIELPNNKMVKDQMIKLDLVTNEVVYLNEKQQEMIVVMPVRKINLTDPETGKPETLLHGSTLPTEDRILMESWFLEVAAGNGTLYRHLYKRLEETKPFDGTAPLLNIITRETMYTIEDGKLIQYKKSKNKK